MLTVTVCCISKYMSQMYMFNFTQHTPSHSSIQGHPRTVLGCPLRDPPDTKSHCSSCRDIPGLSWDVLCRNLRTPSHTALQGRPRTLLGCPLRDPPDTKSHQYWGTSQGSPGMSLAGPSGHQVTQAFRDVPCGILWTPSDHSLDIPLCLDCPGHPIMSRPSWTPDYVRTMLGCVGHL